MIYFLSSVEKLNFKSELLKQFSNPVLISLDYLPKNFKIEVKEISLLAKALNKILKVDIVVNFKDMFNSIVDLKLVIKELKKDEFEFIFEEINKSIFKSRLVTSNIKDDNLFENYENLIKFYEDFRKL